MIRNLSPRVLIIDDDERVRTSLLQSIEPVSAKVRAVGNAADALKTIESGDLDLVLSDFNMPGMSAMELLTLARRCNWDLGILLTGSNPEVNDVIEALRLDACDFLVKPIAPEALQSAVASAFKRLQAYRDVINPSSAMQSAIQRRNHELEAAFRDAEQSSQATLEALVTALDAREHETAAHSFRVRAYTMHLARLAGYPPALLTQLEYAALLHDVGKIAIPDNILLKPGRLSREEFELMKIHPLAGEEILNRVSFLRIASVTVRHHHERFDGKGYPDRLIGEQIPLGARLFALADTLDAITSDRPYRPARSVTVAREEIERWSGRQFDPDVVKTFSSMPENIWMDLRRQIDAQIYRFASAGKSS